MFFYINIAVLYPFFTDEIIRLRAYFAGYKLYFSESVPNAGPNPTCKLYSYMYISLPLHFITYLLFDYSDKAIAILSISSTSSLVISLS